MSKGKRNREKRRALRGDILIADEMAAVTGAEIFAVECVEARLTAARVPIISTERGKIIERAKLALIHHRDEVRMMYADNPKLLRNWILQESGADKLKRPGAEGVKS